MSILATLCWPTTALSEVKRIDPSHVSMHVDEYRFYITRIKELESENDGLGRTLARERASFDVVAKAAEDADKARQEERAGYEARIQALEGVIRKEKSKNLFPGIIAGGRWNGGEAEGVIGLGWKGPLW